MWQNWNVAEANVTQDGQHITIVITTAAQQNVILFHYFLRTNFPWLTIKILLIKKFKFTLTSK